MGLKPCPSPDLALESVRADSDLRAHVERVAHVLARRAGDVAVVPPQVDRARLDHDLRPGPRGLFREMAVEQVSLEDVSALVPGQRVVENERRAIRSDHPRAVDLA